MTEKEGKESQSSELENYPLLQYIETPADLRKLEPERLPEVCNELRQYMISCLSNNPGHFASSMGAVEIITALHYVYNTPRDRLVWDVGHQAYAHKILTGRRELFKTQRTLGGISGFPNPKESEYDTFISGHAGNSISAALGMAISDRITHGNKDRKTVAIIGDASIGNGLAFEGLNNVSNNPNNLLIILNDNDMSIDDNVGALHKYLSDLTTSAGYNRWRQKIYRGLCKVGLFSANKKGRLLRFNNSLKSFISNRQNIFEGLNIRYFGPIDGHDIDKLVKVLREIKDMEGPRILHLRTKKGKGFPTAEENPAQWHAPGKFDPTTGERVNEKAKQRKPLWQEIFGESLVELADKREDIVSITAAMPSGTSVNKMLAKYPERTFDVGISEGHAVTFAGGLAAAGKKPFVAIYSSFLQRAYDNIIHDVAIQKLPVVFCIDRAGLVGEDGVTHHGLLDMVYLRCIPEMIVASPLDSETLRNLMATAAETDAPFAIRYPRGKIEDQNQHSSPRILSPGKSRTLIKDDNAGIVFLSIGPVGKEAEKAALLLREKGISVDVIDMVWLKPLDMDVIRSLGKYDLVCTVEDGVIDGGFGSAVIDAMSSEGIITTVKKFGVPDKWISHASVDQLRKICGFDAESIANYVMEE